MKTKEDKREQILASAKNVFARYGFQKTTLDDVAELVGMKKNSLYHYFESKEDLFRSIIDSEANYYCKKVEEMISKEKSASKKIVIVMLDGRKVAAERVNLYQTTIAAKIEIAGVIESSFMEFIDKLIKMIAEILSDGIKSGEFVKHNSKETAKDIIEMSIALEQREYQKSKAQFLSEINFDDLERRLSRLINMIINGIKKK